MRWIDHGDIALMLFAVYVAVMTLVRMMARRRDQLVADVRRQLEARRGVKEKSNRPSKGRGAA